MVPYSVKRGARCRTNLHEVLADHVTQAVDARSERVLEAILVSTLNDILERARIARGVLARQAEVDDVVLWGLRSTGCTGVSCARSRISSLHSQDAALLT